ncbi:MAG TPA: hypothetical protein VMT88_02995, partial [Actinomycetes bacterium]|nr:hypothetical protein [Actinomycetes bacterium]
KAQASELAALRHWQFHQPVAHEVRALDDDSFEVRSMDSPQGVEQVAASRSVTIKVSESQSETTRPESCGREPLEWRRLTTAVTI